MSHAHGAPFDKWRFLRGPDGVFGGALAGPVLGLGVDWHAIGAARQHAIFHFSVSIDFAGQNPADQEQKHHHAQRDQRPALAAILMRLAPSWIVLCSIVLSWIVSHGVFNRPITAMHRMYGVTAPI